MFFIKQKKSEKKRFTQPKFAFKKQAQLQKVYAQTINHEHRIRHFSEQAEAEHEPGKTPDQKIHSAGGGFAVVCEKIQSEQFKQAKFADADARVEFYERIAGRVQVEQRKAEKVQKGDQTTADETVDD